MNLWPFHRSEPHVQVRYVAATRSENKKHADAQAAMTAQLKAEVNSRRSVDRLLLNAVADGLGVRL